MKSLFSTFFLFLLLTPTYSQDRLEFDSIDPLIDQINEILNQHHIAGAMVAITTKDSVLLSKGFGKADIDRDIDVTEKTLFRMGSITKMFVSIGILQLVEEGNVTLESKLKDIAPEVPFQNQWESTHPIRIIHLLEHTTGFDDIKFNRMFSFDSTEYRGKDMMLVQEPSLVSRWMPGERMAYSNPNYAVLGYVIEKISGRPYNEYLQKNILKPLKMNHSNFNVRLNSLPEETKEYESDNGQIEEIPAVTLMSGSAGALWSSAEDMSHFLQLLLSDSSSVTSDESLKMMEIPQSSLAAKAGLPTGYALGNEGSIAFRKMLFRGHSGWVGACNSRLSYSREHRLGFVISLNTDNFYPVILIQSVIVDYLQKSLPKRESKMQSIDLVKLEPFLGKYEFGNPRIQLTDFKDRLEKLITISVDNDTLILSRLMGHTSKLVQLAPLTFGYQGQNKPVMVFTHNESGEPVLGFHDEYYEKVSTASAFIKRGVFVLAVLLCLSSFLLTVVSWVRVGIGKLSSKEAFLHTLPFIGLGLLTSAAVILLKLQVHAYQLAYLTDMNPRTALIFVGTLSFGLISIFELGYSIFSFRKKKSRVFAIYLLCLGLSMMYLTGILWSNGWIGLRTWAM